MEASDAVPVPAGEMPVVNDPETDAFKADELSPSSMDDVLVPSAPQGDIQKDADTQGLLDPKPEQTEPDGPQVQMPVDS